MNTEFTNLINKQLDTEYSKGKNEITKAVPSSALFKIKGVEFELEARDAMCFIALYLVIISFIYVLHADVQG